MKKLFLSHYNIHAGDIGVLAKELRYRGVVPWVDKQGGFAVADESEGEARRAIREDCFGLLLYATEDVFARWFITHVEFDEAKIAKRDDPRFMLFALPRKIGFEDLKVKSLATYGVDLSANHTVSLPDGCDLRVELSKAASEITRKVLQSLPDVENDEATIQVSTYEIFPPSMGEILSIDGREACRLDSEPEEFDHFVQGLRDAKNLLTNRFGHPLIRVEGAKHLSAAFALGRVFSQFRFTVRQRIPATGAEEYWSTDCQFTRRAELTEAFERVEGSRVLAIELVTGVKNVSPGVNAALLDKAPFNRLTLRTEEGLDVDNELCCALCDQTYRSIDRAVSKTGADEIHIFAAAPQTLMMMLGRRFAGMPPVSVYDWFGTSYGPPRRVPHGSI